LLIQENAMDAATGYASATDLAKQLITLATGILALSITFMKDVLKDKGVVKWPLATAWVVYLLSIIFGMWAMMAITGSLFALPAASAQPASAVQTAAETLTYGPNVIRPALAQIGTFLLATCFLIFYGARMLRQSQE
jgi:hypothetical protein